LRKMIWRLPPTFMKFFALCPKTRYAGSVSKKLEPSVTIDAKIAAKITIFAVESRYPDNVFDFTKEDAELGLKYAERVLDQVKQVLKITGDDIFSFSLQK